MEAAAARRAPAAEQPGAAARIASPRLATASGPLSVRISPASGAIDRLTEAWDELAAHAAEPNAFAERWFVAASVAALAGDDVRLIEVWDNDAASLVGLLPVAKGRRYARLPLPHVTNWLHFHSFLGTPLVRAGYEKRVWTAVLSAIDDADWARGLLHFNGLDFAGPVLAGLRQAASESGRPCKIVHSAERALLSSDLSPQAYYEHTVRKKKRKEIKRLSSRLEELGTVLARTLERVEELESWCDSFLALERSGWKGAAGSALGCTPATERFFRGALAGAFAAGRLNFLRLDLDGQPIAMLVNFLSPPGSFSFKIAFDEAYARFSPGVLIQIENFAILARDDIAWMDSCAVQDHSMINSLWGERRTIVRVTMPLKGFRNMLIFHCCRALENLSAALRRLRLPREQTNDER